jgi:hypothetical protein
VRKAQSMASPRARARREGDHVVLHVFEWTARLENESVFARQSPGRKDCELLHLRLFISDRDIFHSLWCAKTYIGSPRAVRVR